MLYDAQNRSKMATRGQKTRAAQRKQPSPVPKRSRRLQKVETKEAAESSDNGETENDVNPVEETVKSDGGGRGRAAGRRAGRGRGRGGGGRSTLGVKLSGISSCSRSAAPVRDSGKGNLASKIKKILAEGEKEEKRLMQQAQEDDYIEDSDDEVDSSMARRINNCQDSMQGSIDYTEVPEGIEQKQEQLISEQVDEEQQDEEEEDELNQTHLRSIIQDPTAFAVPGKDGDVYWSEDPTREPTLCALWEEERGLYDTSQRTHMTQDKNTILMRFATILRVPVLEIDKRMQTLRNLYQRLHRQCPSGAEPEGRTERQKEVLRLVWFLRNHIKTSKSLTSYKTANPGTAETGKGKSVVNPTIPTTSQPDEKEAEEEMLQKLDLERVMNTSFSPIHSAAQELSPSEQGSDDEFKPSKKHFGRNNRLNNPDVVDYIKRKSPRLNQNGKKTSDQSKVKGSAKKRVTQSSTSSTRDNQLSSTPKKTGARKRINMDDSEQSEDNSPSPSLLKRSKVHHSTPKKAAPKATPKKAQANKPVLEKKEIPSKEAPVKKVEKKKVKAASSTKTAEERMKEYQMMQEKKEQGRTASNEEVLDILKKKKPSELTAAQRKLLMTSAGSATPTSFSVTMDKEWFEKAGSAYRKIKDNENKKKEQDKKSEMADILKSKNDLILKATDLLSKPATLPASATTEEQLWADSLVPHLQAMEEGIKDEFMLHVLSLAIKAKRGKWPA